MPSITPHKKFFFIIYLLKDEHELGLGIDVKTGGSRVGGPELCV